MIYITIITSFFHPYTQLQRKYIYPVTNFAFYTMFYNKYFCMCRITLDLQIVQSVLLISNKYRLGLLGRHKPA